MLKGVKKGLKKKIKGKKSKHHDEEDDLFDPEQLEKLKRELQEKKRKEQEASGDVTEGPSSSSQYHSSQGTESASGGHEEDEEWAKFKALTAGVDTVLKKASEELGAIKETSFFQRTVTDPTNLWRPEPRPGQTVEVVQEATPEEEVVPEPEPEEVVPTPPEDVEPVELDDSLFDTSYLDAIASGQIQLAYIPDSPTEEENQGDDPFDTSAVADVVKSIEEAERRAKRQVNLGAAADFLSGNSVKGPSAAVERKGRARPRAVNLLGDTDNAPQAPKAEPPKAQAAPKAPSLDIFDTKVSLSEDEVLLAPTHDLGFLTAAGKKAEAKKNQELSDILGQFDTISTGTEEPKSQSNLSSAYILKSILEPEEKDELDDEFEALAAESLGKQEVVVPEPPPEEEEEEEEEEEDEEDPFDTRFADSAVVQEEDDDFNFDPRAGSNEEPQVLEDDKGPSLLEADHSPTAHDLPTLAPTLDSKKKKKKVVVVKPKGKEEDPFDTSTVQVVQPGAAEFKQIEQELLNAEVVELRTKVPDLPQILSLPPKPEEEDDFDFDPRADEEKKPHLFDEEHEEDLAQHKILTPRGEEEGLEEKEVDPFDTSCVEHLDLGPGPLELKLLALELVSPVKEGEEFGPPQEPQEEIIEGLVEEDKEFDPRHGEEPDPFIVVIDHKILPEEDLFYHTHDFLPGHKPLTPQQEGEAPKAKKEEAKAPQDEEEEEKDAFDTSSIEVTKLLAPSELKQIEGELLLATEETLGGRVPQIQLRAAFSAPAVPLPEHQPLLPQQTVDEEEESKRHLLEEHDDHHLGLDHKPLTPSGVADDFDPFDTSIAEGVVPGKIEIKYLEEELLAEGRRLSDPDFDPRFDPSVKIPQPIHPATLSFVSRTLEPTKAEGSVSLPSASNSNAPDLKALEAELL